MDIVRFASLGNTLHQTQAQRVRSQIKRSSDSPQLLPHRCAIKEKKVCRRTPGYTLILSSCSNFHSKAPVPCSNSRSIDQHRNCNKLMDVKRIGQNARNDGRRTKKKGEKDIAQAKNEIKRWMARGRTIHRSLGCASWRLVVCFPPRNWIECPSAIGSLAHQAGLSVCFVRG